MCLDKKVESGKSCCSSPGSWEMGDGRSENPGRSCTMLYISLSQFLLLLSLATWPLGQLQTLPGQQRANLSVCDARDSMSRAKTLPTFGRCSLDADKCAQSETRRTDPLPVENPESVHSSLPPSPSLPLSPTLCLLNEPACCAALFV